jgi:hypothetical protein
MLQTIRRAWTNYRLRSLDHREIDLAAYIGGSRAAIRTHQQAIDDFEGEIRQIHRTRNRLERTLAHPE